MTTISCGVISKLYQEPYCNVHSLMMLPRNKTRSNASQPTPSDRHSMAHFDCGVGQISRFAIRNYPRPLLAKFREQAPFWFLYRNVVYRCYIGFKIRLRFWEGAVFEKSTRLPAALVEGIKEQGPQTSNISSVPSWASGIVGVG